MFFDKAKCHHEKIRQHVHEVEGYVQPAGSKCDIHKHCIKAITGKAIPYGNSHVHEVNFLTDINDCHCHKVCGRTGPAIPTVDGHHIHLIEGYTAWRDGHKHYVKVATGIEEPILCD